MPLHPDDRDVFRPMGISCTACAYHNAFLMRLQVTFLSRWAFFVPRKLSYENANGIHTTQAVKAPKDALLRLRILFCYGTIESNVSPSCKRHGHAADATAQSPVSQNRGKACPGTEWVYLVPCLRKQPKRMSPEDPPATISGIHATGKPAHADLSPAQHTRTYASP